MKEVLIFCLCICLLSSCGVPKHIQRDFSVRYQGEEHIELGNSKFEYGLYEAKEIYAKLGAVLEYYMFYPDGIYFTGCLNFGGDYVIDKIRNADANPDHYLRMGYMGLYHISNDTIYAFSVNNPAPPKVWMAFAERFLIVNDSVIQKISHETIGRLDDYSKEDWIKFISESSFLPAKRIFDYNNPSRRIELKEKKWFWESQTKYDEWIELRK